jgi:hypothetical protein
LRRNPCREYLLSNLRLRDPVVDTLLSMYPSLAKLSLTEVKSIVDPNMALLRDLAPSEQITKLVCTKPKLLAMPLSSWYQFLSTYGLSDNQVWDVLSNSTSVMLQGSIYQAGKAIMFLKSLGWSDLEINVVIIPGHAHILKMDVESELKPIMQYVNRLNLTEEVKQDLLQRYPCIFRPSYKEVIHRVLLGADYPLMQLPKHLQGQQLQHQLAEPDVAEAEQVAVTCVT